MKQPTMALALICTLIVAAAIPGRLVAQTTNKTDRKGAMELYAKAETQDDLSALKTLDRAKQLDPDNEQILFRIGFLLHKMNRLSEAKQYYQLSLKGNPCYTRSLNNLGGIETSLKHYDQALSYYTKSSSCDPEYYLPYYNIGNIYRERGEYSLARDNFRKALRYKEDHFRSHHNIAILLLYFSRSNGNSPEAQSRLRQEAEDHLLRATQIEPADPLSHLHLGEIYESSGRLDQAAEQYDLAYRHARGALRDQLQQKIKQLEQNRTKSRDSPPSSPAN